MTGLRTSDLQFLSPHVSCIVFRTIALSQRGLVHGSGKNHRIVAAIAMMVVTVTSVPAAVVQTTSSSATELVYSADASSADLLHGLTATTTGWNLSNHADPQEIHDGVHGNTENDPPTDTAQGGWTTVGATAEYHLGLGAGGNGWDITRIQSIAAWIGAGFGNQAWTVEVKRKGAGRYTTLATVDYQPHGVKDPGATKVVLTDDDTGVLASGVEYVKFTANPVSGDTYSGAFVWRELDVMGVETGGSSSSYSPLVRRKFEDDRTLEAVPLGASARGDDGPHSLAGHAFDGNFRTKWVDFSPQKSWIRYRFKAPLLISGYAMTSADDHPERDPRDWILQGSQDGASWTTLDKRQGVEWATRLQERTFTFQNESAYGFYRFKISRVRDRYAAHAVQIAEIWFIE